MILVKEILGLRLREDILRGVRLFAIVFAAILVCVAAYRMLKAPADVQGAAPDGSASSEAVQPSPEPSPEAAPPPETASEVHPLVVPEPPPVNGAAPKRANRPRNEDVPPPPPPASTPVRARKAPVPSGKEFESSNTVALPVAPVEEAPAAQPLTPKQMVGYKSLIEANKDRLPADPTAVAPVDDPEEPQAKGNRFFRALGKIFHPSGKKETEPSSLQPKQQ
jgi:hypothetical protein